MSTKTTKTAAPAAEARYTVTGTGRKWYVADNGIRQQDVTYTTKRDAEQAAADMERSAKAAAKKAAKPAAEPKPAKAEQPTVDPSKMTKVEALAAAKAERLAVAAWKKAGEQGPKPPTPVKDWMAAGGTVTPPAKSTRTSGEPGSRSRVTLDADTEPAVRAEVEAMRADGKSWKAISAALGEHKTLGRLALTENQVYILAKRYGWKSDRKAS